MPIKAEYSEPGYSGTKMDPVPEYLREEIVKRIIGREMPYIIAVLLRTYSYLLQILLTRKPVGTCCLGLIEAFGVVQISVCQICITQVSAVLVILILWIKSAKVSI
jgi:hypothetical protein